MKVAIMMSIPETQKWQCNARFQRLRRRIDHHGDGSDGTGKGEAGLDTRRSVGSNFGKARCGGVTGHASRGSNGHGASSNGDNDGGVSVRTSSGADGRRGLDGGGVRSLRRPDGADNGLGGAASNDIGGGRDRADGSSGGAGGNDSRAGRGA